MAVITAMGTVISIKPRTHNQKIRRRGGYLLTKTSRERYSGHFSQWAEVRLVFVGYNFRRVSSPLTSLII